MKLTAKQKEIIRKARETDGLISGENLKWKQGEKLLDKGLVKFVPYSIDYQLTELGKTIVI